MYETVDSLFTGICDAIREKDGTTALISHQEIPARIAAISGADNIHLKKIDSDLEDMSTWTQANNKVKYTHSYENGVNRFYQYTGGGGYERWVKELHALETGKTYMFCFNMWSPTGFEYGHYDRSYDSVQAAIFPYIPNDVNYGFVYNKSYAKAFISFDPSQATSPIWHYLFFNYMAEDAGQRYIMIDTGGIKDGVPIELDISDISLYEVEIVNI